jgi:hypothetical protein
MKRIVGMMRLLVCTVVILFGVLAFGQPRLEFEKTVHDFGQINESGGTVEYTFIVRNSGNEPLVLNSVKASCGCTTPFWTNEPIAAGQAGKITASYNPYNRPGPFNKSLSVVSNAANGTTTLYIKGQVIPRVKSIEDHLPIKYGALRMKHRSFNFGRITTEKTAIQDFEVYNDSDEALLFKVDQIETPDHISLTFVPEQLAPKTKGVIRIAYDPNKKNALGYQSDKMVIKTNESADGEKILYVISTVEEFFPAMTDDELAKAPRLKLSKTSHDFGKVVAGAKVETELLITNEGKSDLMIRNTQSNCDCVVASYDKSVLKPGESTKLKLVFDTMNRNGRQYKNVTVFSNDPNAPTQMITLKAEM